MRTTLGKALAFGCAALVLSSVACKKEDETAPTALGFRSRIEYSKMTDSTEYKALFTDSKGDTTVDLSEGNERVNMFKALDAYAKKPNPQGSTTVLSAATLKDMYSNVGDPFVDSYVFLNTSSQQLKEKTAVSSTDAPAVRAMIESYFDKIAATSAAVGDVAAEGKAGKLNVPGSTTSAYLVDANGIEWAQAIAKSLIGAYQIDYIGNTLLGEASLNADNTKLVSGKKYTQLEHNWDEAFGSLTLKKVYLGDATASSNGGESFLGSYVWEYNKTGYAKIHPAFLKGRIAIVNNEISVAKDQANLIRREFEKAIGAAAAGYMKKAKDATNDAARAHAYGEGIGFIYSLRYCKITGVDAAFSDALLTDLNFKTTGIWKLTTADYEAAITKINNKFGL